MMLKLVATDNVAELPVENYKDIAHRARKFADSVEAGEWDGLRRAALILDTSDGVFCEYWGETANGLEIVGLLEVAKLNLFRANEEEDDD